MIKKMPYGTVMALNSLILSEKYTPAELTEWLINNRGIKAIEGVISIHCEQIKKYESISQQLKERGGETLSNSSYEQINKKILEAKLFKKLSNALLSKLNKEKDKLIHKNSQPKPDNRLIPYAGTPTDKPL
ncbi:MAG: hypothetical protein WCS87_01735 [Methylococcaceae bacterium]